MKSRRAFFASFASFAATVALAPKIAFGALPKQRPDADWQKAFIYQMFWGDKPPEPTPEDLSKFMEPPDFTNWKVVPRIFLEPHPRISYYSDEYIALLNKTLEEAHGRS